MIHVCFADDEATFGKREAGDWSGNITHVSSVTQFGQGHDVIC